MDLNLWYFWLDNILKILGIFQQLSMSEKKQTKMTLLTRIKKKKKLMKILKKIIKKYIFHWGFQNRLYFDQDVLTKFY